MPKRRVGDPRRGQKGITGKSTYPIESLRGEVPKLAENGCEGDGSAPTGLASPERLILEPCRGVAGFFYMGAKSESWRCRAPLSAANVGAHAKINVDTSSQ